jgi:two-component system sensor histidine kinase BaeS
MKFWRPGITGKLFVAIFATCIVLLITMHWAVRVSFERGFIDYIKHGNEQRLQGLSDALGEQYTQHGNWRFLRNNDRFVFQILRSLEHDNDDDRPGPGMPPHGWRTQFWVIDQDMRVLVGPRAPVPPDGTKRAIVSNGATVGWVIASPVERLTRNTDINFDRQQRQTSWLIVALSTLLAALATFPLARGLLAPVKRLVEGTHKLAAGDFSTRVDTRSQDELGKLAQDFNQLASTLEKNQPTFRTSCVPRWRCCAASWRRYRTACASSPPSPWPRCRLKWARSPSWWTTCTSSPCPTKARWPTRRRR